MDTFYKELIKMKEETDSKGRELNDWRTKMSNDLVQFYKKYDAQTGELNQANKMEKEQLNNTLNEISDSIGKSKYHSTNRVYRQVKYSSASKGIGKS